MSSKFKRFRSRARGVVPGLFEFGKWLGLRYSKRSYLRKAGFFLSARLKQPVRADGSPLPWMNYNAISFLEKRLTPELSLFEFGGGNSTLFFARLVRRVVAVECDQGWYERLRPQVPANVELEFCGPYSLDAYLEHLRKRPTDFDVIVIDAEDRESCLLAAPEKLSAGGVIVLDDAQRPSYQAAIQQLLAQGFRKLDFEGLKPGNFGTYRTTIFYRPGNVLGI